MTTHHAKGTSLTTYGPWGLYLKARAVCPDGVVRAVRLAHSADTYSSIPAHVSFRKTTVRGFVSLAHPPYPDPGEPWVKFTPTGRHQHAFDGPSALTPV